MDCTIFIDKPAANLPPVLDTMFDRSMAISEATRRFWDMKLAHTAKLGEVKEHPGKYEVHIIYRQVKGG